jgi:protein involved in polysaccharide export with SLBB domain
MRLTRGLFLTVLVAILSAGGLVKSPLAYGQADLAASPAQLELLKNLSPEQREELLRQFTGGGTDLSGLSLSGGNRDESASQRQEELRRAAMRDQRARADDQEELRNGMPVLKGDDWVIINITQQSDRPDQEPTPPVQQQQQQLPPGALPPGVNARLPQGALPSANPASATPPRQAQPTQRAADLTAEERERREAVVKLVRSRNPYRLSPEGVLMLPGFTNIPLAGLTAFEATVRLQAEPQLDGFDVSLVRIPLRKTGTEALKPFGYDLFDHAPSTFAPVTNVPVPADYIVGSGDELEIQLYGNQNRTLRLRVQRDGRINFPELGPISVAGQLFSNVRSDIESRVERQMIGVRASVSMGDTRSIRVFVVGEARYPGSYTISGLGTITSALFAAGGVKPIGSLRNIQLKRQNTVVRTFDLYDMLIRGDSTDDAKLLPGDVVFIPPVGPTVTVEGEVRRPAIYEAKKETTPTQMIELAGGLTAQADTSKTSLTRINEQRQRVVLNVNPTQQGAAGPGVRNGDILQVFRLNPTLDSGIVLEGYLYAPGRYAYRDGLRLTDVIHSVDELKPNADINYLMIRRELPPNREITVTSADLGAALSQPGSAADVLLMPRDRIIVFDLESSRDRVIRPIMDELRAQSNYAHPSEVVSVDGMVRVPGEYPLEPGMTVKDLIRAGGSLKDSAYGGKAELTRYRVINGDVRRTEQIQVDLAAVLRGDAGSNVLLEPFDNLSVRQVPEWGSQDHVIVQGEVRFPGRYSIRRGETLKSVISRAGGLSELAFPEGSVFTRIDLKDREQKQLDNLATRLQSDLSMLALQSAAANQAGAGTALTVGQSLLSQVRSATAVGRLVIDLPVIMRGEAGSSSDIILRDGDRLMVPKFQQEVTVIGEVQTATSHLYRPELSRDDYISQSGGVTRRADNDRIYVVRADGSVVANDSGRWFSRSATDIRPGDTIVVPTDTERMTALPFWQAVTQIIYNLAISAAAVNSFGN